MIFMPRRRSRPRGLGQGQVADAAGLLALASRVCRIEVGAVRAYAKTRLRAVAAQAAPLLVTRRAGFEVLARGEAMREEPRRLRVVEGAARASLGGQTEPGVTVATEGFAGMARRAIGVARERLRGMAENEAGRVEAWPLRAGVAVGALALRVTDAALEEPGRRGGAVPGREVRSVTGGPHVGDPDAARVVDGQAGKRGHRRRSAPGVARFAALLRVTGGAVRRRLPRNVPVRPGPFRAPVARGLGPLAGMTRDQARHPRVRSQGRDRR